MIELKNIQEALREVYDPELPINVFDLGLIYDITITDTHVNVTHTLTSPMCPFAEQICSDIYFAVLGVDGVETVDTDITFDPPFTIEQVPEETRLMIGYF